MPLSIFRQLAGRRPVGFLGQNSARIGSIRRQSSSGTSQIVPSGLCRGLRRDIVVAPVARCGAELAHYNSFTQRAFLSFSDSF
jgi:hypothetical protein